MLLLQFVVGRADHHRRHPPRRPRRLQPQDLPQTAGLRPTGIQVSNSIQGQAKNVSVYSSIWFDVKPFPNHLTEQDGARGLPQLLLTFVWELRHVA